MSEEPWALLGAPEGRAIGPLLDGFRMVSHGFAWFRMVSELPAPRSPGPLGAPSGLGLAGFWNRMRPLGALAAPKGPWGSPGSLGAPTGPLGPPGAHRSPCGKSPGPPFGWLYLVLPMVGCYAE